MVEWTETSSEVVNIARELIDSYHPLLREARIGFIFRSEASKSQGLEVYAKASKVDDKTKALLESKGVDPLDFLIWIAEDKYKELTLEQRQALIDHELCHCVQGTNGYTIRGHDFEEFSVIVERYGLWNLGLLEASHSFKQALQLDLGLEIKPQEAKGEVVAIQHDMIPVEA